MTFKGRYGRNITYFFTVGINAVPPESVKILGFTTKIYAMVRKVAILAHTSVGSWCNTTVWGNPKMR